MWWKELVGYQIYPKSFKDSNGDGIGDLKGIIEKLDYLKDLGIDLIWVSPFFKSPNDDNGYDISDYKDILEEFGTIEDFDDLLLETHKRGMKLIIDLVINHTSDEHPWFIEARESKDSPKRDWYIWREGKEGQEPNNWESIFKGSAWEKCEKTNEYYLHLFSKKQPDLNWENKEMRKELYNMINWWLDKGIDGFRVDAISHIKKVEGLPDMPNPNGKKYVDSFDMHMNIEGIQEHLKELKEETFAKYDIVTVGEANGVDAKSADEWVSSENGKFNMIFQFEHLKLWNYEGNTEFCPKAYKDVLNKWQVALENKGWNALFIPRSTSTWGNDGKYWLESAKSFATTYFLQKGTPFIYQGQEIGMTNTIFNSFSEFKDVKSLNEGKEKLKAGMCEKKVLEILSNTSRDNARTPMQWDDSINAGFTTGRPWLKVNSNYKKINVKNQIKDKNSIYNYYKKLISLKKNNKTLTYGEFKLVLEDDKHIFAYLRELDGERYFILSNLSENEKKINLSEFNIKNEDIILSNYEIIEKDLKEFVVRPFESVVYKI